jgi:histidinol-phosphate aminotransferase
MAGPAMINLLDGVLAPYALCQPVIDNVLDALSPDKITLAGKHIEGIVAQRDRLAEALAKSRDVDKVWPSQSNFLLVRFHDIRQAQSRLVPAGILIRDFSQDTRLQNCARITVGTRSENDRLLEALV